MKAAVLVTLFAAVATVPAARACRYCQQAADPVEVMRFQGQGRNAGSFPLDDSLNNFANGAPTTPATAAAPVTRAADLPPAPLAATATVPISRPTASTTRLPAAVVALPAPRSAAPVAAAAVSATPAHSVRWADLGLLGLLGAGGFFAWRTRGTTRPAATA